MLYSSIFKEVMGVTDYCEPAAGKDAYAYAYDQ